MLIVLHGALGSAHQFQPLLQTFPQSRVLEFYGHGAQQPPSGMPTIDGYVQQLEELLETQEQPCSVFGYSMGGYVAILLALRRPELFRSILTLGTKLEWTPAIAVAEAAKLNPVVIQQKVPAFAQDLARRHGENRWTALLAETSALMSDLGANPRITPEVVEHAGVPIRLCVGDRDEMVSIEETLAVYRGLQRGERGNQHQFAVIPGLRHPIEKAPRDVLEHHINEWCIGTT